jgi:hypothetical protein
MNEEITVVSAVEADTPAKAAPEDNKQVSQSDENSGDTPAKTDEGKQDQEASEAARLLAQRKQSAKERVQQAVARQRIAERDSADKDKTIASLREQLAKRPNPESYEDNAEYTADMLDHKMNERELKRVELEKTNADVNRRDAIAEQWAVRVDEFKATTPDFEDVAYSAPISDATAHLIAQMEDGPQVAYALGKNPAEARKIERLPETLKAVELGKIAARLSNPTPKKTTQAPEPINPVLGRGSSTSPDPEKMNFNEFKAYREKGGKINM